MKPRFMIASLLCCLFLLTNSVIPQVNTTSAKDSKQVVSKNSLKGLCHSDACTRLDCAVACGMAKCQKAVIPLMKMLREDPSEAVRIVAAQSLIQIGDPIGVYLVSRSAIFNDSEKVRALCEKFYNAYAYEQYVASQKSINDEEILATLPSQE